MDDDGAQRIGGARKRRSQALDGNLVVDLRTLDTGIGLRNRHLRENYLEVDKAPGFETATLSEIHSTGWTRTSPKERLVHRSAAAARHEQHGHGAGRRASGGRRSSRQGIVSRRPAGICHPQTALSRRRVKDTVHVEVTFEVSR